MRPGPRRVRPPLLGAPCLLARCAIRPVTMRVTITFVVDLAIIIPGAANSEDKCDRIVCSLVSNIKENRGVECGITLVYNILYIYNNIYYYDSQVKGQHGPFFASAMLISALSCAAAPACALCSRRSALRLRRVRAIRWMRCTAPSSSATAAPCAASQAERDSLACAASACCCCVVSRARASSRAIRASAPAAAELASSACRRAAFAWASARSSVRAEAWPGSEHLTAHTMSLVVASQLKRTFNSVKMHLKN